MTEAALVFWTLLAGLLNAQPPKLTQQLARINMRKERTGENARLTEKADTRRRARASDTTRNRRRLEKTGGRARAALEAKAETVKAVDAEPPFGASVEGLKVQLTPGGRPAQANETEEVKPF